MCACEKYIRERLAEIDRDDTYDEGEDAALFIESVLADVQPLEIEERKAALVIIKKYGERFASGV